MNVFARVFVTHNRMAKAGCTGYFNSMGFDGFDNVELIMDMEDVFGISISDRDAERIQTADELHAYLVGRVTAVPSDDHSRCASAAAFYHARRALVADNGIDPRRIGPDTSMNQFLPTDPANRRSEWRRLGGLLKIKLPPMEHPRRVVNFALLVGVACFFCGITGNALFLKHHTMLSAVSVGLLPCSLIIPSLILFSTRSRAVRIPRGYQTVGQVSSALARSEIDRMGSKTTGWTRQEVWEVIRFYTAKSAGISPALIKRDTNFVRDLV